MSSRGPGKGSGPQEVGETMEFIPFDEWLQRNPDLVSEDCEHCGGDGIHVCECGDQHDCGYCAGTGGKAGRRAHEIYRRECDKARAMLATAPTS